MKDSIELAKMVVEWWEEHQYDEIDMGEEPAKNMYSESPIFVVKAKEILSTLE